MHIRPPPNYTAAKESRTEYPNRPLVAAIEASGLETLRELGQAAGYSSYHFIGKYLWLERDPIAPNGTIRRDAFAMAQALDRPVESLFPPETFAGREFRIDEDAGHRAPRRDTPFADKGSPDPDLIVTLARDHGETVAKFLGIAYDGVSYGALVTLLSGLSAGEATYLSERVAAGKKRAAIAKEHGIPSGALGSLERTIRHKLSDQNVRLRRRGGGQN